MLEDRILFVDGEALVIDKPAGLPVDEPRRGGDSLVARLGELTPVPGAPDFLVGITNRGGEILAVMDLRPFFGLAAKGLSDLSRVIVLSDDQAELGVLADAIDEVIPLRTDEVLEPPLTATGIGREYLRGVTADALIVLDGGVLLRDPRLCIDQGD